MDGGDPGFGPGRGGAGGSGQARTPVKKAKRRRKWKQASACPAGLWGQKGTALIFYEHEGG